DYNCHAVVTSNEGRRGGKSFTKAIVDVALKECPFVGRKNVPHYCLPEIVSSGDSYSYSTWYVRPLLLISIY
ncbi:hypothetical protein JOM56_015106, partial [Amanita muscaria]